MAEIKRLKKLPKLDMNPMVDMAFLLVSFFMMTTTFKTDTPTEIAIPYSLATLKIPDKDICMITIGKTGDVYLGIDNKFDRIQMLEIVEKQNGLQFSEEQKEQFSMISSFGVEFQDLTQFLTYSKEERKGVDQPGIPMDTLQNEFRQWIIAVRSANPRLRFAIHADQEVPFPTINMCFETLRDLNITRFNLITDTEIDDSDS